MSTDFEKSAKTAAASVRLLASQVSLELSSYVGGPSFVASTSHIFLRAITWPLDRGREVVGGEGRRRDGMQAGPEIFARLSRVSCRVDCCHAASGSGNGGSQGVATGTGDSRPDLHGDVVLKPFDVDVHLTRPKANSAAVVASSSSEMSAATRGWHAGIYVDQLYARFGAAHARSLERLAEVFLPALAAAELAATELARRQHASARAAGAHGRATSHVNDLRVLERVDCFDYVGEEALKPRPGQAVFHGVGTPQESQAGGYDAALHDNVPEDRVGSGGWVNCCEWHYWGLRRVAQVVLPYAPLCANIPLLEGLVLDSLEVELSFVDPLTGSYKVPPPIRCSLYGVFVVNRCRSGMFSFELSCDKSVRPRVVTYSSRIRQSLRRCFGHASASVPGLLDEGSSRSIFDNVDSMPTLYSWYVATGGPHRGASNMAN